MFTDTPYLSIAADLRHRELLVEADRFRLVTLAKAARREARAARRRVTAPRPVPEPAAQRREAGDLDAERRYPVPR
ncbi:hypothetical protein ACVGOW_31055 [Pseudonocardia saturnea]